MALLAVLYIGRRLYWSQAGQIRLLTDAMHSVLETGDFSKRIEQAPGRQASNIPALFNELMQRIEASEIKGSTPANAVPTFAKPLTPFPRTQKQPTSDTQPQFARPLTPFPRRPTPGALPSIVQPPNQSESAIPSFGTVMSFPAADPSGTRMNISGVSQGLATPVQVIRTSVIGPEILVQDTPELFEIEVTNNSPRTANNIVVQMGVSENLTITDFDRYAWLDEKKRTVSWKLDSLQSGYKEVIRFRAVSATPGRHEQSIAVGMENSFQGRTGFVTNVISNPNYASIQRPAIEK